MFSATHSRFNVLLKGILHCMLGMFQDKGVGYFCCINKIFQYLGKPCPPLDTFQTSSIGEFTKDLLCHLQDTLIKNLNRYKKLELYASLKKNFGREKYLDLLKDVYTRRVITKFRLSDHNLDIEKGRHRGVDRKNRFCSLCNSQQEIGDEYHVLFLCKNQNIVELRTNFLSNIATVCSQFLSLSTLSQFQYIMLASDTNICRFTSTFIRKVHEFTSSLQ